jgi:hypothetical protein
MEENSRCPFFVPASADHRWVFPVSGYCWRTDDRLTVSGTETFARRCATFGYAACPAYQASAAETVGLIWGARGPRA